MAIRIEPIGKGTFIVNNKQVCQDSLGNWCCKTEFSTEEKEAWAFYKKAIIDQERKLPIMTIKY